MCEQTFLDVRDDDGWWRWRSLSPLHAQEAAAAARARVEIIRWSIITAGFALAIAAAFGAMSQAKGLSAAVEGIARNPSAAGEIRGNLILGLVLIESLVIYVLLISLILFFVYAVRKIAPIQADTKEGDEPDLRVLCPPFNLPNPTTPAFFVKRLSSIQIDGARPFIFRRWPHLSRFVVYNPLTRAHNPALVQIAGNFVRFRQGS